MKAVRKQGDTYKTLALSAVMVLQLISCGGDVTEAVPPPGEGEGGSAPGAGGPAPARPGVSPVTPPPAGPVGGSPEGGPGPGSAPAPSPTPTPPGSTPAVPPVTVPPPTAMPVPPATPTPTQPGAGVPMPPLNPAIDALCTPMVIFQNLAPTTVGGMRFTQHVPDAVATMQRLSREVCALLYRKPEEVPRKPTVTLLIDPAYGGVAVTGGGNRIRFSPTHIANQANNAESLSREIHGVLAHEITHVWQKNQGGTGDYREAVADWTRYRVGYDLLRRRRPGQNWSDAYTWGGFFISWLEEKFDRDFGYKLNVGMSNANFSYPNLVMQVTGKNIDAVWLDYQAELRAMMDQEPNAAETDYETMMRIVSGHQDLVDQALDLGWRRAIDDPRF